VWWTRWQNKHSAKLHQAGIRHLQPTQSCIRNSRLSIRTTPGEKMSNNPLKQLYQKKNMSRPLPHGNIRVG
jgi:hypothetical protein